MKAQILQGDALAMLRTLDSKSVHCCVTSPPYWGLRDYGVDGQLGLEGTPAAYVCALVAVFEEVRRVLRDDGTFWLNLGDSYASQGGGAGGGYDGGFLADRPNEAGTRLRNRTGGTSGLKPKDLIGIPWRVAFALQEAGWYLRQEIIWAKPNPMPESVTDRCTKAHESLFLLAKSERYYFDAEAIKEPSVWNRENNPDWQTQRAKTNSGKGAGNRNAVDGGFTQWSHEDGRNKRSVWTVPTRSYKEAHFAVFPPDLIKPCILAGCPEGGTVLDCFAGSGTTLYTANSLCRHAIGIELNSDYVKLIEKRLAQGFLDWTADE